MGGGFMRSSRVTAMLTTGTIAVSLLMAPVASAAAPPSEGKPRPVRTAPSNAASDEDLASAHPTQAFTAYDPIPSGASKGKPREVVSRVARPDLAQRDVGVGNLSYVGTSPDLNCQAQSDANSSHPDLFYGGTACGTFLTVSDRHFGPEYVPAGSSSRTESWVAGAQTVTGTGTAAAPFRTVSRAVAGDTGLSLAQVDTWVAGSNGWTTTVTIRNTGTATQSATLYRAADCYIDGSDSGGGYGRGSVGSATCVGNTLSFEIQDKSNYSQPSTAGTLARARMYVNSYDSVWNYVGSGQDLPNTWLGNQIVDNGQALQWNLSVRPGQMMSVHFTSTLSTPSVPLAQLPGPGTPGVGTPMGVSTTENAGDPVNTATGAFYFERTDATLPGPGWPLALTRSYSSDITRVGSMGKGWVVPWDSAVVADASGTSATVTAASGASYTYLRNGTEWQAPPGGRGLLVSTSSGYQVIDRDGIRWNYNTAGRLFSIVNARGHGVTIPTRDTSGRPTTLRDSMGREASLSWTSGRLAKATLPGGRTYTYTYTNGFLTKATTPGGMTESYSVDGAGRITAVVEGSTQRISNIYDSSGRVTKQLVYGAGSYSFHYAIAAGSTAGSGNLTTTVTNPEGRRTAYAYAGYILRQKTEDLTRVTTYEWDADLNLTATVDADGHRTTYAYNRAGDQVQVASPNGSTAWLDYDASHRVVRTSVQGSLGDSAVTTAEYNAAGELTKSVAENGGVTTWVRDGRGRPTATTDPMGRKLTMTYDSVSGQLASVTDALGRTTTIEYDTTHVLPIKSTTPGGSVTQHVYDADGNEIERRDAVGARTRFTYDAGGRRTSTTDALGRQTVISYRADGVVRKVVGPDGVGWNFIADSEGRVTKRWATSGSTDLGRTTTSTYAANGLTAVVNPEGDQTTFERSQTGDLLASIDGASGTGLGRTDYRRNEMRELVGVSFSDGTPSISTTRDLGGRVVETAQDNVGISLERSASGAVSSQVTTLPGLSATVTNARDLNDQLTGRTYPDGSSVAYGFDAGGQVTSVSVNGQVVGRYSYTFNGNVYKATYKNGLVQDRAYDKNDRLLSVRVMRGTTVVSSDQIVRDVLGRPTQITQSREGLPTVSMYLKYTTAGRVDRICSTANCSIVLESFTYDPLGNVTKRVRGGRTDDFTMRDRSDRVASQQVSIGSNSNSTAWTYDGRGRVTAADGAAYGWDAQDRLVSRTVGSNTLSWTYDPVGRPAVFNGATSYVWDNEEDGQSRLLTQKTGSATTNYVYGPLGAEFTTSGTSQDVSTLASDLLGSITAITDGTGRALRTYRYDTFGSRTQWAASGTSAPVVSLGYAGALQFGDLVSLGRRVLDACKGRFLSTDPALDVSGQSYAYAANSPYEYTDRSGALPTIAVGAVIGAVGGSIWSGVSYGAAVVTGSEKASARGLAGAVVGGAVGGAITGACVGTGAGALASAACGAAGGAASATISGAISGELKPGEIGMAAAIGGVTGGLGGVIPSRFLQGTTRQIQNKLRFTNRFNGGISPRNILPWSPSGQIGRWMHEQTAIGGALGFGAEMMMRAAPAS